MEDNDLKNRIKELAEIKQQEEAETLKRLQQDQARLRIQQAMQEAEATPPEQPQSTGSETGDQPIIGGGGHVEMKPEQKDTEINIERIEKREGPPSHFISREAVRRMQGRRPIG